MDSVDGLSYYLLLIGRVLTLANNWLSSGLSSALSRISTLNQFLFWTWKWRSLNEQLKSFESRIIRSHSCQLKSDNRSFADLNELDHFVERNSSIQSGLRFQFGIHFQVESFNWMNSRRILWTWSLISFCGYFSLASDNCQLLKLAM